MNELKSKIRKFEKWVGSIETIMVRLAVGWGHDRNELPKAVVTQRELVEGFSLIVDILKEIQSSRGN